MNILVFNKYDYKIMARLIIDTGVVGNAATGDTLRTAMTKANDNFSELYTDLAATTSSNGNLTNSDTNGNVKIFANGTGIVEIDRLSINDTAISSLDTNADITLTANGTGSIALSGPMKLGTGSANATITSNGAHNLVLDTNSGTNSGTITIVDGANGNITIENDGTGDILLKAGGQVGIGNVSSPDTSLHVKSAAAKVTLQRTADGNTPGLSFQNSGGNVRAELQMDGTSGTSNTVFVKTHDGSSLAERFRVTHTGAKVSGTLDVDGGISVTDNKITASRSNDNLVISASGTGEVEMSSSLLVKGGTPFVKIQRTDNANVPGVSFVGSAGTAGANILFDGTSGTANELIFQTFTVAGGIAEAFRVQQGGAKVTGSLDIDGGISITDNLITASASNANLQLDATGTGAIEMIPAVILMANLPTSDPSNAGQLYNDSGTLKISAG